MKSRRVGILLYPEVQVLDFAGSYDVFSIASRVFVKSQFRMGQPPHAAEIEVMERRGEFANTNQLG